jgi:hypothetical protein
MAEWSNWSSLWWPAYWRLEFYLGFWQHLEAEQQQLVKPYLYGKRSVMGWFNLIDAIIRRRNRHL